MSDSVGAGGGDFVRREGYKAINRDVESRLFVDFAGVEVVGGRGRGGRHRFGGKGGGGGLCRVCRGEETEEILDRDCEKAGNNVVVGLSGVKWNGEDAARVSGDGFLDVFFLRVISNFTSHLDILTELEQLLVPIPVLCKKQHRTNSACNIPDLE